MKTRIKFSSVTWISILLVLCFLLSSACKKPETGWKGEIKTVDGVKVAHNFEPDPEESFKPIEFIVDLSIGVDEGEDNYMFSNPADIDSDTEGNIYVLDYQDCVIKKYDPHGKFVAQLGRKGQGPGEFTNPYSMTISHQNLIYAGDINLNKIEVFSPTGVYQKTMKVDFRYYFSINKKNDLIIDYAKYDRDGSSYYNVGRFDFQKNETEELFSQRTYWPARIMNDEFRYEFPYYVRWDINSKDHIYVASAVEYEISVFSPEGKLLFKFIRDFNPVKVSGEEMKKISDSRYRKGPNPFRANLVYPVFKFISIDEKDRIWIEHYQPDWRKMIKEEKLYDVFSFDGKFLFSTKITGHIYRQLIFKNGYLYALARVESGYSRALRLRMREE